MAADSKPFWKVKSLNEMTVPEWESLCDGCARCCMIKLEDEDSADICYTRVACQLLDTGTCRCGDYQNRFSRVPDCVQVSTDLGAQFNWLPSSCAYRRLYEGRDLPSWHPLVSEDVDSVHKVGISMRGRCVSESHVHESLLQDQIIDLPDFE